MKLSVIIPMYNAEKYIERCLDSLLNQNIAEDDFEVLILNDGSFDNSPEIVEKYSKRHKNIILYNDENEGPDAKRNKGIRLSRAKYIYFVDADDYLAYNTLGVLLEFALKKDLDVLGFESLFTYDNDNFNLETPISEIAKPKIVEGTEILEEYRNMRYEIWWYLIKKDFLTGLGVSFDPTNVCADVMVTLQLFLNAKKTAFYPVEVYRYYQSTDSITRSDSKESLLKLISSFKSTIVGYSDLINKLEQDKKHTSPKVMDNLRYRRDYFVFFIIPQMIKAGYSYNQIKENLNLFKNSNAYPIKNFIGVEYNSLKYRLLDKIFNTPGLLKPVPFVYRLIK